MEFPQELEQIDRICRYRPHGECTLSEAVEPVTRAITYDRLLINATGLVGIPVPSLVDRFLLVEEWAQESTGMVVVVLVIQPEYILPDRFRVKVAAHFGLTANVYTDEADALRWLEQH